MSDRIRGMATFMNSGGNLVRGSRSTSSPTWWPAITASSAR
ncbi:hypothetical protein [Streptomyces sp. WI04-05B]